MKAHELLSLQSACNFSCVARLLPWEAALRQTARCSKANRSSPQGRPRVLGAGCKGSTAACSLVPAERASLEIWILSKLEARLAAPGRGRHDGRPSPQVLQRTEAGG